MTESKPSAEDGFRDSLKDVLVVADKLSLSCLSVEEMIGMVQLALENDGQLRLLMAMVAQKK